MANPILYGGTQPNKATSPMAAVNALSPSTARSKNTFNLTKQRCQTERWADIMPIYVNDLLTNDDFRLVRNVDQRPQSTFQSPLMSTFRKHFGYFAVPKSVIYPRLWTKIFVNPKKGDDLVFKNCRAVIIPAELTSFFSNSIGASETYSIKSMLNWLRCSLLFCRIYSSYSLLPYLGLNFHVLHYNVGGEPYFVDEAFFHVIYDSLNNSFTSDGFTVKLNFSVGTGYFSRSYKFDLTNYQTFISVYDRLLRDTYNSVVDWDTSTITVSSTAPSTTPTVTWPDIQDYLYSPYPAINIERLISYQMCISQFFTSDDVDNIYTSELWYQNLNGIAFGISKQISSVDLFFSYNDINVQYEPYSGSIISSILNASISLGGTVFPLVLSYFENLFEIGRSLRYGDMFNAARLQPLAVGDYSAPVTSNSVSAVDMTKATLMQRFLNNVNATRNTYKAYTQMLFGVTPDDAPLEPHFVAHSVVNLGSDLVANTAENQGQLETNLVLHDGAPEFDIHVNQDTIVLGLTWYDTIQLYAAPTSPFALHVDRFDDANPMLQNVGDVSVFPFFAPSYVLSPSLSIFGYLQNDYEYKQDISEALGGFVDGSLSGSTSTNFNIYSTWAFIRAFDIHELSSSSTTIISSYFIRNQNREFDIFYKSLTGVGSSYYHFVCSYVFEVVASRPLNFVSGVLFNSSI